MIVGIVGKKIGMTRIFTEQGEGIPVTVVHAPSNRVSRIKCCKRDGYSAVQLAWGTRASKRLTKPIRGFYTKAGLAEAGVGLVEFVLKHDTDAEHMTVGKSITVQTFTEGQTVDVSGTSIGKGFAGVVKRHGFKMQPATHGCSLSHRAPGSIGQRQDPGRVFKGRPMAGHMGAVRRTMQNLLVIKVDVKRELLLIRGGVPGAKGSTVIVRPAIKAKRSSEAQ